MFKQVFKAMHFTVPQGNSEKIIPGYLNKRKTPTRYLEETSSLTLTIFQLKDDEESLDQNVQRVANMCLQESSELFE